MRQFINDSIQFVFFLISMTILGIAFVCYAIYTLFYYLLTRLNGDAR